MVNSPHEKLTRREREIMHVLFAVGNKATAEDIRTRLTRSAQLFRNSSHAYAARNQGPSQTS